MAHRTGHVIGLLENDGGSFLQPLTQLIDLGIDLLTALPYPRRKRRRPATTRSPCQALCPSVYVTFIHRASPASSSDSETSGIFILSAHCKKVLVAVRYLSPVGPVPMLTHFVERDAEPRQSLHPKHSLSGDLTRVLIVAAFAAVGLLLVVPCVADAAPFYLLEELNTLGGFEELLQAEQGRPRHMVLQVHLSIQHPRTREARLPNLFPSLRTRLRQEELSSAVDHKLVLQNQNLSQYGQRVLSKGRKKGSYRLLPKSPMLSSLGIHLT